MSAPGGTCRSTRHVVRAGKSPELPAAADQLKTFSVDVASVGFR